MTSAWSVWVFLIGWKSLGGPPGSDRYTSKQAQLLTILLPCFLYFNGLSIVGKRRRRGSSCEQNPQSDEKHERREENLRKLPPVSPRVLSRVSEGKKLSPKTILLSLQYISNYIGKIIQTFSLFARHAIYYSSNIWKVITHKNTTVLKPLFTGNKYRCVFSLHIRKRTLNNC